MSDSTPGFAIRDSLDMYTDLGFDAIPLRAGSKQPLGRAWQTRSISSLWSGVPADVNIGIRGGGQVHAAFIDCDEKAHIGTFSAAQRWLAGRGYLPSDYPVIATASGIGRHIYIALTDELPGNIRKLAADFGAGEFRYGPGGHVAAPPSQIIGGLQYRLLDGDLRQLPQLELKDILPILSNQDVTATPILRMSRKAYALLHGRGIERYHSRSEADAMLMASLINKGYPFETIVELFACNVTSGKYRELVAQKGSKPALHYLSETYKEVLHWTQTHESKSRRLIQSAMDWALSRPWSGRTGAVDRMVFMAHMDLAYNAGKTVWAAATRDLALLAGLNSNRTAARASHRLCSCGFIAIQTPAIGTCASVFQLVLTTEKLTHSPSTPSVRECVSSSSSHDAFRYGGLGKSCEHIFQALQAMPGSIDEVTERTGHTRKTVQHWIERMSRFVDPLTGEFLPLIGKDDTKRWYVLPIDLDKVARALGTHGTGERQRAQYTRERRAHEEALSTGRRRLQSASESGAPKEV